MINLYYANEEFSEGADLKFKGREWKLQKE